MIVCFEIAVLHLGCGLVVGGYCLLSLGFVIVLTLIVCFVLGFVM